MQIVADFDGAPDRAAVAGLRSAGWQLDRRGRLGRSRRPTPPKAFSVQATGRARRASPTPRSPWSSACATRSSRPRALSRVANVDVGGETARSHDVRVQISGSMWKIVLFVLALSYLVLMVMLRSLLLPLKAVLMNLLSIGAAFGVLVAIFQWGWFDSLLGFESQGALDTINVPLIFAIVFGLSMDYEVFLMSRIRERYRSTATTSGRSPRGSPRAPARSPRRR